MVPSTSTKTSCTIRCSIVGTYLAPQWLQERARWNRFVRKKLNESGIFRLAEHCGQLLNSIRIPPLSHQGRHGKHQQGQPQRREHGPDDRGQQIFLLFQGLISGNRMPCSEAAKQNLDKGILQKGKQE